MIRSLVALLAGLLLAACAYRTASPPVLNEDLRLEVASNQGRLVRSQLDLTRALAQELQSRYGWRIHPAGNAVLRLTISEELIDVASHGSLDIPRRWRIGIAGSWELTSTGRVPVRGPFRGDGWADGLRGESAALAAAAETAAAAIADGLEDLPPPPATDRRP